jgi:hypothetical protein
MLMAFSRGEGSAFGETIKLRGTVEVACDGQGLTASYTTEIVGPGRGRFRASCADVGDRAADRARVDGDAEKLASTVERRELHPVAAIAMVGDGEGATA